MKEFNKVCYLLFIVLLLSCKNNEKNGATSDDVIRDRYFRLQSIGWKSKAYSQKVDDVNFTAIEVPIQYYLLRDKGSEDLKAIDVLYEENKRERVIEFTFQQDEEKDLLQKDFTGMSYDETVKYMSFGLDKDFYVVTSKRDTIRCSGVTYERNYKIAPFQRVLIFFSGIEPNEKIQLIYKDYLFRKGILKFKFKDPYTEIAL